MSGDIILSGFRQIDEHPDKDVHAPCGLRLYQEDISFTDVQSQVVADVVCDLPDQSQIRDVCFCRFGVFRMQDPV